MSASRPIPRFLPDLVSFAGIAAYGFLVCGHIHGQVSVLDEGLYLFKGLLFSHGEYRPFEDYGPLTNHMPLAFLIPGWVGTLFGAGIRTGRIYALALGLTMLVGLWLTCRRVGSPWWGAAAVWAVSLNGSLVKIYSQATSQVLVVTMITWMLALGLGRARKVWQTTLAAALAGALWMTRINMVPVLPILLAYLWSTHGRRAAGWAAAAGGGIVLLGHAIYWPEILKLWAKWLPRSLTPFLNSFRDAAGGVDAWRVEVSSASRWSILIGSVRRHLLPIVGAIGAWISFPGVGPSEEDRQRVRDALFLSALLLVLTAFHTYATLGLTYCPYCLTNYLGFFSPVGLILLALAGAHWAPRAGRIRQVATLAFLLGMPFVLGYAFNESLGLSILSTDVPRISLRALRPGTIETWELIQNSTGLSRADSAHLLSSAIAILVALLLTLLVIAAILRGRAHAAGGIGRAAATGLITLVLATSTISFGNSYQTYDCGADVIRAHEAVGADLREKVASQALIYWGVAQSPLPLLYLDRPHIFPPQLNGIYTFRLGGNPHDLERFSYWNQELAREWLAAADYVLVDVRSYGGWIAAALSDDLYDEILRTPPTNPCRPDSAIMIFRRLQDPAGP